MKDQPKPEKDSIAFGPKGLRDYHDAPFPEGTQPTTGEWECPDCHTRKTTTGAWTADDVASMARWSVIADAHNAAIAAKATELHDEWWERVQDANKQLAAEREKSRILGNMTDGFREQLAAEREAKS